MSKEDEHDVEVIDVLTGDEARLMRRLLLAPVDSYCFSMMTYKDGARFRCLKMRGHEGPHAGTHYLDTAHNSIEAIAIWRGNENKWYEKWGDLLVDPTSQLVLTGTKWSDEDIYNYKRKKCRS